jgi:hypothetical protein
MRPGNIRRRRGRIHGAEMQNRPVCISTVDQVDVSVPYPVETAIKSLVSYSSGAEKQTYIMGR